MEFTTSHHLIVFVCVDHHSENKISVGIQRMEGSDRRDMGDERSMAFIRRSRPALSRHQSGLVSTFGGRYKKQSQNFKMQSEKKMGSTIGEFDVGIGSDDIGTMLYV